jgi:hypothetical protein
MAIFTTQEAAEAFVAGDPFVENGVVRGWQIRAWHEAYSGQELRRRRARAGARADPGTRPAPPATPA